MAPATTEIYTLSLHDALPISWPEHRARRQVVVELDFEQRPGDRHRALVVDDHVGAVFGRDDEADRLGGNVIVKDRKSTRLNSSHSQISYAIFCLKKKNREPRP